MLYVNGRPETEFGGKLKNYQVSSVEISEVSYSHMRNRSTLQYHNTVLGLKKITFFIDFSGKDENVIALRKSLFDGEIYGKSEIILPDGFLYSAVCNSLGQEHFHSREIMEVSYDLIGIRHGPKQTAVGNTVFCGGTLPKTDCILTVMAGASGKNYKLGTVTFPTVTAGEILCVDGITKRILVNGVPAAQRAEWLEFPYLKPGLNTIDCKDPVTVEFYPAYF